MRFTLAATTLLLSSAALATTGPADPQRQSSQSQSQSQAQRCPPTDKEGTALTGSGLTPDFVTCNYSGAGSCTYFSDGGFSSGSSECPAFNAAATSASATSTETAPFLTGVPAPSASGASGSAVSASAHFLTGVPAPNPYSTFSTSGVPFITGVPAPSTSAKTASRTSGAHRAAPRVALGMGVLAWMGVMVL
ncbi:hypothetical protein B0H15DRAFT_931117 [Mycena belliarum]|uniref:Uncharacterized protein n=1 Tax=Mycena belliarum TaxID=1033014 RepID=A0AAD6U2K9_9AGAR|nr:hypothetical protein B0H15DRAFT_931117 [Mycena belliae]